MCRFYFYISKFKHILPKSLDVSVATDLNSKQKNSYA